MRCTYLRDIEEKEVVKGYHAKFIHSDNMTVAFWHIEADHDMPEHAHPNEQIFSVIEGKFELTVGREKCIAEPGSVVVIPSNVRHAGTALTDCKVIDIFYPARKEYQ